MNIVPKYQSDWTRQMNEWLEGQTLGMVKDQAKGFILTHWYSICESWGCKEKANRTLGCVANLSALSDMNGQEWVDFVESLQLINQHWSNKR